jgi:hypothetical protein
MKKKKTVGPESTDVALNLSNTNASELGFHMSNALFYGWLDLESLHRRLSDQLKACEELIILKREQDEFNRRWNPKQVSLHLILNPDKCKCMWCSPHKRPIKLPEDDYKK